jgi:hypothetical protein
MNPAPRHFSRPGGLAALDHRKILRTRHLLIFLLALLFSAPTLAQWSRIGAPVGGSIRTLLAIGDTIVAGTTAHAGVFISTNGGEDWRWAGTGLPQVAITTLATDGSNIFTGPAGKKLHRSTDGGNSWSATSFPYTINSVLCSGDRIMLAESGGSMHVSTDRGGTWAVSPEPPALFNFTPLVLAEAGGRFLCGYSYNGVSASTDSGTTWTLANEGLGTSGVLAFATLDSVSYAGTDGKGVYRSTFSGSVWTPSNTGLANRTVNALAVLDSLLFAGTDAGLFCSSDRGASWSLANEGLPYGTIAALAISHGNVLAGTAFDGVYRSTDRGQHWSPANSGLTAVIVGRLFTCDGALFGVMPYMYRTSLGFRLIRSTDGGNAWMPLGSDTSEVYHWATDGTSIFIHSSAGLLLTTDNGATWDSIGGASQFPRVSAVGIRGSHLMIGTWGTSSQGAVSINISTNRGSSWTNVSNPGPYLSSAGSIRQIETGGNGTYLIWNTDSGIGRFQRSTDNGLSWQTGVKMPSLGTGGPTGIHEIEVDGDEIYASIWSMYANTICRSADQGQTWTLVDPPSTGLDAAAGWFGYRRSTAFRILADGTVYYSMDSAKSWTLTYSGLDTLGQVSRTLADDAIFAASYDGFVYRFRLQGTVRYTIRDAEGRGAVGDNARVVLSRNGADAGEARTDSNAVALLVDVPTGPQPLYRVYSDRPTAWGEQFWGMKTGASILPYRTVADTFVRNAPYMLAVQVYVDSTNELLPDGSRRRIPPGTKLRVEIRITNPSVPGAITVRAHGQIVIDRDRQTPFDKTLIGEEHTYAPGESRTEVFYFLAPADTSVVSMSCGTLSASDQYGVTLTDGSAWYEVFKASLTGVAERTVPITCDLEQNFPNPFNPSTLIRFSVPAASHVSLIVFNLLGQQVVTLVDRMMDAGYHEVSCDAARLPSGVYLYRMRVRPSNSVLGRDPKDGAGEFTATRRLVVVK